MEKKTYQELCKTAEKMYYQVISPSAPNVLSFFQTLKAAKEFTLKYYPLYHCIIRHVKNGRTIKNTHYYPKFGFETITLKEKTNKMKKYELASETKVINGVELHRIKALKSFGNIKKGELKDENNK